MRELRQQSEAEAASSPQSANAASSRIVDSIQQAAHLLDGLLAVNFSDAGVNNARFAALRFIGQAPNARCTQRELAQALNQSESSVSGLISRMRADGLVYRLRSKEDQRKRQLMLSAKGRKMLAECDASYSQQLESVLSRFEATWLEELTVLLEQLVAELSCDQQNDPRDQPKPPFRRSA